MSVLCVCVVCMCVWCVCGVSTEVLVIFLRMFIKSNALSIQISEHVRFFDCVCVCVSVVHVWMGWYVCVVHV